MKGLASPDDPHWAKYWEKRNRKTRLLHPIYRQLAHYQKHVCPVCGDPLQNGEPIQRHHMITDRNNLERTAFATNASSISTATSKFTAKRGNPAPLKSNYGTLHDLLEPCDLKGSRTVLRGGSSRDAASLPDTSLRRLRRKRSTKQRVDRRAIRTDSMVTVTAWRVSRTKTNLDERPVVRKDLMTTNLDLTQPHTPFVPPVGES